MKIVLLNSGGKDSLATAIKLRKRSGYYIVSLYLHVGHQNDEASAAMAKRIAEKYCDEHHEETLTGIKPRMTKQGFPGIPYQAGMLHLFAASWGASREIFAVASGQRTMGVMNMKDMDEALQAVIKAAAALVPMSILELPVAKLTEDEVYEVVKDEPLWHDTIPCNYWPPCGKCVKCKHRADWEAK